jgi:hypothetical protein
MRRRQPVRPSTSRRLQILRSIVLLATVVAAIVVLDAFGGPAEPPGSSPAATPAPAADAPGSPGTPPAAPPPSGLPSPASPPADPQVSARPPTPSPAAPSRGPVHDLAIDCERSSGSLARADDLLANRYTFSPHPTVALPADPAWSEDPLGDRNWRFQLHTLRFTWDLFDAWSRTDDDRYLERAAALLRDWIQDNPRARPPSVFSWNDHSTAWRAMVLACAAQVLPEATWARDALELHGRVLADPAFYVRQGNHALNQNRGLLAAGCVLDRPEWQALAVRRLEALVTASVDEEGVTNEQAVFYQRYNYLAYRGAERRLEACGLGRPDGFSRLDLMPHFLAHATMPDGAYATLGDSNRNPADLLPGTTAEYASTAGTAGPKPDGVFAKYRAGFIFGRTGWGERRAFEDEAVWTLRFGPGRQWHGHDDGGSVTLFGYGARLIEDPGTFTVNFDEWREYAIGRTAHNVVTVDGLRHDPAVPTRLLAASSSTSHDDVTVLNTGDPGVEARRRVLFSRSLGYLVVEDRLTSSAVRTFRQLWHLESGSAPLVSGTVVRTRRERGNVTIIQLAGQPTLTVIEGRLKPVQGWLSHRTAHRIPAPVIEASTTGKGARYLTLIVPTAGPDVSVLVRELEVTAAGWSFVIDVDGTRERVTVQADHATLTQIP